MSRRIIYQAMNDDYLELSKPAELTEQLTSMGAAVDPFYFNVYLDQVSSESTSAFGAIQKSVGCFLSVYPDSRVRKKNFIAKRDNDRSVFVTIRTGEHQLRIPRGLFVSFEAAISAIQFFCETGALDPRLAWVRYDELGMELYDESE